MDPAVDVELSNLNNNPQIDVIDNRPENVRDISKEKPRELIPALPSYAAPITVLEPTRSDLNNFNNNNNNIHHDVNNISLQRNLSIVLPSVHREQKIKPSRTFHLNCCDLISRRCVTFCHIILFFFVITILVLTTLKIFNGVFGILLS